MCGCGSGWVTLSSTLSSTLSCALCGGRPGRPAPPKRAVPPVARDVPDRERSNPPRWPSGTSGPTEARGPVRGAGRPGPRTEAASATASATAPRAHGDRCRDAGTSMRPKSGVFIKSLSLSTSTPFCRSRSLYSVAKPRLPCRMLLLSPNPCFIGKARGKCILSGKKMLNDVSPWDTILLHRQESGAAMDARRRRIRQGYRAAGAAGAARRHHPCRQRN